MSQSARKVLFNNEKAEREIDITDFLATNKFGLNRRLKQDTDLYEKELLEDMMNELRKKEKEIEEDNWKYDHIKLPI